MKAWALFDGDTLVAGPQGVPGSRDWEEVETYEGGWDPVLERLVWEFRDGVRHQARAAREDPDEGSLLARELPTLEEKVDALLEGGQALADLKQRIAATRAKYPGA